MVDPFKWLFVVVGGFGLTWLFVHYTGRLEDAYPAYSHLIWLACMVFIFGLAWMLQSSDRKRSGEGQEPELPPETKPGREDFVPLRRVDPLPTEALEQPYHEPRRLK
jgi:hypothetical protein